MTLNDSSLRFRRPLLPIRARLNQSGIILLVVLGMLTLFSMLAASYLVFTNQQRFASFHIHRAESSNIDSDALLDTALERILVGTNGPDSSLWGHDILGDLYGTRDAIEGNVAQSNQYEGSNIDCAPEALLGNPLVQNFQVIRFPTRLHVEAHYPFRRNDEQVERRYPGYPGPFLATPPDTRFPADDMLSGRLLTFVDGPLAGLPLNILRSFGDHRNAPTWNQGRESLSGQVYLDIREHLSKTIGIDGESKTLREWFQDPSFSVHRLFYQDVVTTANMSTTPPPLYGSGEFYINGRMLSGPGLGWDRLRTDVATVVGADPFNLNERVSTQFSSTFLASHTGPFTPGPADIPFVNTNFEDGTGVSIPVSYQGNYARYRFAPDYLATNVLDRFSMGLPPGDTDEPYDAPDYNNLFLSYFPNDPALGEPTPSFVRPALINWIVNQQPSALASLPVPRLQQIVRALQRCTLRPLPIIDDVAEAEVPAAISSRQKGVLQFEYDDFTGSNPHPGFTAPIRMSAPNPGQILLLAQALAGDPAATVNGMRGSWDVDNNGDQILDSVWTDAGLPVGEAPSGKLYKPLVSYMVEDLGGRVDVNRAGNLAQGRDIITKDIFGALRHDAPVLFPDSTALKSPVAGTNQFDTTGLAALMVPTGFGYGPAEIDVRGLFSPAFSTGGAVGQALRGPNRLVREKLLSWSITNGFVSSTTNLTANTFVASGQLIDPLTAYGNDYLGAIRDPLRANLHNFRQSQGLPMDVFGRAAVGLDVAGTISVGRASQPLEFAGAGLASGPGDANDDPYEFDFDASTSPDAPFADSELVPLLNFDAMDRDLAASRLVALINGYHDQLPTTSVERDQVRALMRVLADSITTRSNSVTTATGGLPTEWNESTSVLTELVTSATTLSATAAAMPQQLFIETINAAVAALPGNQRDQARNALLAELIAPEVRAGGKLNVNRPFGNGVDDDADGLIDEATEVVVETQQLRFNNSGGVASNSNWSSTRGDVTPGEPNDNGQSLTSIPRIDVSSRAAFARHLYVLVMFLIKDTPAGTEFAFPGRESIPTGNPRQTFIQLTANPLSFEEEYTAWKVAQWAVNVVDFRDADAIMTRFDYDPNPYDGWDVRRVNVVAPNNGDPTYRTVWGLEFPELTLEESLAFHDRKVRNTNLDTSSEWAVEPDGSAGVDPHPDQYEVPEGSLFLEVRSTRLPQQFRIPTNDQLPVANPMAFPSELYTNAGTVTNPDWQLDLGRLAPDSNPVWRVAITRHHDATNLPEACADFWLRPLGADRPAPGSAGNPDLSSSGIPAQNRETFNLDPTQPQFFGATAAQPVVDRIIWFSGNNPDTDDDGVLNLPNPPNDTRAPGQIFYNRTGTQALLQPGQIAVVAPRLYTSIGSQRYDDTTGTEVIAADGRPMVEPIYFGSKQRIGFLSSGIGGSSVEINDFNGNAVHPTFDDASASISNASARPIQYIIAASNPPTVWTGTETQDRNVGLNISEPYEVVAGAVNATINPYVTSRSYYDEPTERLSDLNTGPVEYPINSWHNFDDPSSPPLPNEPFDMRADSELDRTLGVNGQRTGTWSHYKTAYLQRLADPTANYHPQLNPYISVDYIALDLTVFNGSQENGDRINGGLFPDPNDQDPYNTAPTERFASRYKSGLPIHLDLNSVQTAAMTYSVNTVAPERTTVPPIATLPPITPTPICNFHVNLNITTDVNSAIDAVTALPLSRTHSTTLGWTNQSYGRRWQQSTTPNDTLVPFVGLPFEPFRSNLAWLNRPFVSPLETMWVPSSAPGRIGMEFGTATAESGFTGTDRYSNANNSAPALPPAANDPNRFDLNQRYPHLMNFFSSSNNATTSPNLWRLLEWIEVPPPFDSDVDFISPEANPLVAGEDTNLPPAFDYSSFFNPPSGSNTDAFIDASPLSWNLARPGAMADRGYDATSGRWISVVPGSGRTNGFWTDHVALEPFRPPFSFRSGLFRGGLVNLNTVKNSRVYRALMFGISDFNERDLSVGSGAFSANFINSRRGYVTPMPGTGLPTPPAGLHQNIPTQFDGAFKPAKMANIRPQLTNLPTPVKTPLSSSVLRSAEGSSEPLFNRTTTLSPTISPQSSVVHDQIGQTRLANLATDQSNVFAVWITVGLFEVDSSTLTVGRELGEDTGQIQRFRSFHIIDRSQPVTYRPGERNNAMETVRLSRVNK